MFSSSSLVKLIMFEKQKTGKTNKNSTHTEEQSTVAAICGAILEYSKWKNTLNETSSTETSAKETLALV